LFRLTGSSRSSCDKISRQTTRQFEEEEETMPAMIEVQLDLPHVHVVQTRLNGRDLIEADESTLERATCPNCGEQTSELHSYWELNRPGIPRDSNS
jgi:hypothetical protein